MRVFVSSENVDAPLPKQLVAALAARGWDVDHSPRNPSEGPDERWPTWYSDGCTRAMFVADVAVSVVTTGWSASTWMAIEAETALDEGAPLFLWNPESLAIPDGMRGYGRLLLPSAIDGAVATLAEYRAAPDSSLDRDLRRLDRFLRRLPGCPEWTDIVITEEVLDAADGSASAPSHALSPAAYRPRFEEFVRTRPWVNLHAAGMMGRCLVVTVEVPPLRADIGRRASVQLSGPTTSITSVPGWVLRGADRG